MAADRQPSRLPAIALGAIVVLAIAGCARNSEVDSLSATYGLPSTQVNLEAEDWVLVPGESSLSAQSDRPITFVVDDDRVSGSGGCNVYGGTIDVDGDSVEITDIFSTLIECDPAPIMDAEREYLAALADVDSVDFSDDYERLELSNDDGVLLVFDVFDAKEALVGEWIILNLVSGDGIVGPVAGTSPSVTFDDDGNVTLETGCNTAQGSWEFDGDQLSVDPLRQTLRGCPEPAGVEEQETALVRALEAAHTVQVAPGTLTILNEAGNILLVAAQ